MVQLRLAVVAITPQSLAQMAIVMAAWRIGLVPVFRSRWKSSFARPHIAVQKTLALTSREMTRFTMRAMNSSTGEGTSSTSAEDSASDSAPSIGSSGGDGSTSESDSQE